jgi:hypothetical protein
MSTLSFDSHPCLCSLQRIKQDSGEGMRNEGVPHQICRQMCCFLRTPHKHLRWRHSRLHPDLERAQWGSSPRQRSHGPHMTRAARRTPQQSPSGTCTQPVQVRHVKTCRHNHHDRYWRSACHVPPGHSSCKIARSRCSCKTTASCCFSHLLPDRSASSMPKDPCDRLPVQQCIQSRFCGISIHPFMHSFNTVERLWATQVMSLKTFTITLHLIP